MEFTQNSSWLLPGLFFSHMCVCSVSQSCPILRSPMDCSLPGSSTHGIFQARILEWVATSSSRGFSWPRDWNCISHFLHCQVNSLPLVNKNKSGVGVLGESSLGEGFQWVFGSLQRMSRKDGASEMEESWAHCCRIPILQWNYKAP